MIRKNRLIFALAVFFFFVFLAATPFAASAFQLEKLNNVPISGDYVLTQPKVELRLNPGESVTRVISVINRSGSDLIFSVSVEDFSTSTQSDQNLALLGERVGIYSLKDYLRPEISSFTLHHGEQMALPVAVKIPENAQPGALYAAVIFAARPLAADATAASQVQVISRLASLFFVRINGEVLESGRLLDFSSAKTFYFGLPLAFEFNYKNSGNVYLNPYGELKISSIIGQPVYSKWIPPYFVLPGAIRQTKETVERNSLFGMYQATLKLNRGYGNYLDEKSLYFFVLPIPYLVAILAVIIIVVVSVWRLKVLTGKNKNKSSPNAQR